MSSQETSHRAFDRTSNQPIAPSFSGPSWPHRQATAILHAVHLNEEPVGVTVIGFRKRGGKLIVYDGWSDAAIAPESAIRSYETVVKRMGQRESDAFLRLYMVPLYTESVPFNTILGSLGQWLPVSGKRSGKLKRVEAWALFRFTGFGTKKIARLLETTVAEVEEAIRSVRALRNKERAWWRMIWNAEWSLRWSLAASPWRE